jgi:hypothetical protein
MFPHLMTHLSIARPGPGRPRTRPNRVRAYSSRAIRGHLRRRDIVAVIPEPSISKDTANAAVRAAGALRRSTPLTTATATSSNAASAPSSSGAGWPPLRYKLALTFRGGAVLKAIATRLRVLGDTP